MKNLNQSQIAVIVGLCLSLGVAIPAAVPPWNGQNLASFSAAKALAQS